MSENSLNLKTQFEVRYTPILNFPEVYKRIFTPYLRLAKFNIFNQNQITEYIILMFENEGYQIDCRFDRIIFVSEGVREDLKKSTGPFLFFFEILQKIKDFGSFGKINNALLSEWNLKETVGKNNDEIVNDFSKKFLTLNTSFNIQEFPDKDYKLTLEFKNKDKQLRYEFGPFQYEKDVEGFQLNQITKKEISNYKNYKGLLINATYFENTSDPQFSTYKSFSKILNENSIRIYL